MPDRETVEGWSNYPTWAVNLWLANDRKLYDETRALVAGVVTTATRSDWVDTHRGDVARALKARIEPRAPELKSPFDSLLSYALSEVDWYELAQEWITNEAEFSA